MLLHGKYEKFHMWIKKVIYISKITSCDATRGCGGIWRKRKWQNIIISIPYLYTDHDNHILTIHVDYHSSEMLEKSLFTWTIIPCIHTYQKCLLITLLYKLRILIHSMQGGKSDIGLPNVASRCRRIPFQMSHRLASPNQA